MSVISVKGTKIEAVAACVPENVINNREFAKIHFEEDMSPLIDTLGIETRHVCAHPETTALDMCVAAAETIFGSGKVNKADICAIVFVTQTPDYLVPNNASGAHSRLGLDGSVLTFDINHACAGFVYGLYVSSLISGNTKKKVLLLVGDTNSRYAAPKDRGTSLLFGDAGTATIISNTDNQDEWYFNFNTEGEHSDKVRLDMGYKHPLTADSLEYKEAENGNIRRQIDMFMDGAYVFDYALKTIPSLITEIMDEVESEPDEYDRVLAHQSNAFLLRKIARKAGIPKEKVEFIISEYGNCSSSCIPLILSHHQIEDDERLLLYAMGGGLSAGVADITKRDLLNFGIITKDF